METAKRELTEEFLAPAGLALPSDAVLRPFVVKQTRPIQSRSQLIVHFVALADENPWLAQLDQPPPPTPFWHNCA